MTGVDLLMREAEQREAPKRGIKKGKKKDIFTPWDDADKVDYDFTTEDVLAEKGP